MRLLRVQERKNLAVVPKGNCFLAGREMSAILKAGEGTSMTRMMTSFAALSAVLALGTAVSAQNTVTLQSQDDAVNLTGELVSFEDDIYVIRTNLGALRISADRVKCSGAACPTPPQPEVVEAVFTPGPVVLRSLNGSTEIQGNLLSFEDDTYLIETGFGQLQVAANDALCIGDHCPVTRAQSKEVAIASSSDLSGGLVTSLIAGFAEVKKLGLTDTALDDNATGLVLASASGEEFASMKLTASTSAEAAKSLVGGSADLFAASQSVRDGDRTELFGAYADALSNAASQTVIALDAVAIAVAPQNPVATVAQDSIARVFAGEITDWSQLGGNAGAINVYASAAEGNTGAVFKRLILNPAGVSLSANVTLLNSDEDVAKAVMSDPNGIGYTSYSTLNTAKALSIRGVCGIETPANEFTIKTEEYPLSKRVYMYQPRKSVPQPATELVAFMRTNPAQSIIKSQGYIGQDVTSVSINDQGMRFVTSVLQSDAQDVTFDQLQGMMTNFVSADRLSLTFRFEPASATLDTRAQADVQRLANMIKAGAFENKQIIVAGFSDSVGDGGVNISLSEARAEQVRNSIISAAGLLEGQGVRINTVGYGELSPLGCNETAVGRSINRRVEIWTKDIVTTRLQ